MPTLLLGQNTGQYIFIYREKAGSNGHPYYHLSEIGLYGLPNLVEFATVITTYSPKSAAYGATNLNSNLGLRTQTYNLPPYSAENIPSSGTSSCFVVNLATISPPLSANNPYVLGLDHIHEKM